MKPKNKNIYFCGKFGSIPTLRSMQKGKKCFVMSLRLSDLKVLHIISSSSSFFDFAEIFSLFSLVFSTFKFLEFKEFNKTIIPFALVKPLSF